MKKIHVLGAAAMLGLSSIMHTGAQRVFHINPGPGYNGGPGEKKPKSAGAKSFGRYPSAANTPNKRTKIKRAALDINNRTQIMPIQIKIGLIIGLAVSSLV